MKGKATYPKDHQPGMKVPRGGSMCANCKYVNAQKGTCSEENFIAWNGSPFIPGDIHEYCSDWWKGRDKEQPGQRFENVKH